MPQTMIDERTQYALTYTSETDWVCTECFEEIEDLAIARDREAANALALDAERVLIAQL